MSVWMVCPSARPAAEVNARIEKWHRMGYKTFLQRDQCDSVNSRSVVRPYRGYTEAMNYLIADVFRVDRDCDWVVCAADDIDPDPSKPADEIARECSEHFVRCGVDFCKTEEEQPVSSVKTFGVMQPTGDRWGENEPHARAMWPDRPAYIDRIAGSPWIGREFARRVNQGRGPWWPEYTHMHSDEELFNVAMKLGVYWERRDLIHFHDHWGRKQGATLLDCPTFLKEANSPEHWSKSKALFMARKADGFKGSECIA